MLWWIMTPESHGRCALRLWQSGLTLALSERLHCFQEDDMTTEAFELSLLFPEYQTEAIELAEEN
jgi:hypothetical protein